MLRDGQLSAQRAIVAAFHVGHVGERSLLKLKPRKPRRDGHGHACEPDEEEEGGEKAVVVRRDARPDPRTVMVVPQEAALARAAVRAAWRTPQPARCTPAVSVVPNGHLVIVVLARREVFDDIGPPSLGRPLIEAPGVHRVHQHEEEEPNAREHGAHVFEHCRVPQVGDTRREERARERARAYREEDDHCGPREAYGEHLAHLLARAPRDPPLALGGCGYAEAIGRVLGELGVADALTEAFNVWK
mmetsp:Transcript_25765/g.66650  ORF Transcript_25765/g.66650 Transcript_25765/m.66650 type:complete len:245 (-) Transcript_25765:118-852(-)